VTSFANNKVLRYNGASGAFMDAFVAAGSGGVSGPWYLLFVPHPTVAAITVTKVPPTVTPAAALQSANTGVATSFDLGSFGDGDVDRPWTVTVPWGDNQSSTFQVAARGSLGSLVHTYAAKGLYTVTEKVADKNGVFGTATFQVVVGTLVVNTA